MSKPATGGHPISPKDVKRLEDHLRGMLKCPGIALDVPTHRGASVEVRVGPEVVGTVDQVDEDGERYWAITLVILEDELPGGAGHGEPVAVPGGAGRGKPVTVPVVRSSGAGRGASGATKSGSTEPGAKPAVRSVPSKK